MGHRVRSLVVLAALVAVLPACGDAVGGVAPGAAPTATSPTTSVPPAAREVSAAPSVGVTTLEPVPPGERADFGRGVAATVTAFEPVDVVAEGPGDTSGPGVAVRLLLRNGSPLEVDLSGIAVTASADGVPAIPSSAEPAAALSGRLPSGRSQQGTYVFRVPDGATSPLVVEVGLNQSGVVVVVEQD